MDDRATQRQGGQIEGSGNWLLDLLRMLTEFLSEFIAKLNVQEAVQRGVDKVTSSIASAANKLLPKAISTPVISAVDKVRDWSGLGSLSAKYEGGRDGIAAVALDSNGHYAYGKHQLNSARGSGLTVFMLANPDFAAKFDGLRPDTPAFNARWKELARLDPKGFEAAQDKALARLVAPLSAKAEQLGVKTQNDGVREAVISVGVQHRRGDKVLQMAAEAPGFQNMSPADQLHAIYAARNQYVASINLAPKVEAAQHKRYALEERDAVARALADKGDGLAQIQALKQAAMYPVVVPPSRSTISEDERVAMRSM